MRPRSPNLPPGDAPVGLPALRSPGRVSELLFLYETATRRHGRLRSIAQVLGLSVQAVSLLYRDARARGWVEEVDGTYRPTLRGIEHLHNAFGNLTVDLEARRRNLAIIRQCWAVAGEALTSGEEVSLVMEGGFLRAKKGRTGPSRGRALQRARRGDLVEVGELQGVVSLRPCPVEIYVLPESWSPLDPVPARLVRVLRGGNHGLLVAEGLEAYHVVEPLAARTPPLRFGGAAAARDASQVGVPALVVVTQERLASLLKRLEEPPPAPPVLLRTLGRGRSRSPKGAG